MCNSGGLPGSSGEEERAPVCSSGPHLTRDLGAKNSKLDGRVLHKIHQRRRFQGHSSTAVSTFTWSPAITPPPRPQHPPQGALHLAKRKETVSALNTNFLFPPSPSPTTTILLSVSVNLTPPGTSFKWNHRIFVFLWLFSFSEHSVSKVIHGVAGIQVSYPHQLHMFWNSGVSLPAAPCWPLEGQAGTDPRPPPRVCRQTYNFLR